MIPGQARNDLEVYLRIAVIKTADYETLPDPERDMQ